MAKSRGLSVQGHSKKKRGQGRIEINKQPLRSNIRKNKGTEKGLKGNLQQNEKEKIFANVIRS